MGPIWPSYYGDCGAVMFVVDAANPTQVSSSCVQLLALLSAPQLACCPSGRSDLPCYMSLVEMQSLFRMQDIVSCATQPVTVLEASWLRDTFRDPANRP
uniref:ADP ribosylation factor like GTPase 16 n=1 Tax=Anas platyrhynchos TaxID=8839 RepID=A0A8B9SIU1_ANAPL